MTSIAFNQADLIRRVASPEPIASMEALAADLGRDSSNVRKSVKTLASEGVFDWTPGSGAMPTLTDIGRQTLRGIDIAQGVASDSGDFGPAVWPADKIVPNPLNRAVKPEKVAARADSIAERGLIQPLSLTPIDANGVRMLVDGEYRWRAHLLTIEQGRAHPSLADGLPFVEREVSEEEALAITIVANTERENLSPWEDAQQLFKIAELTGKSGAEIARLLGRPGAKDVQDKIRLAREATTDQIATYQENGSWDAFRNAVFGRVATSDPNLAVYRAAVLALLTETYGVSALPEGGQVPAAIEDYFRRDQPAHYCVAHIAQLEELEPLPTDPWLTGGWKPVDMAEFARAGTVVGDLLVAPRRALIPDARSAPTLTLYAGSGQRGASVSDGYGGERYEARTTTLYRARAVVTLPDGREIESTRIPGSIDKLSAIQIATEDLIYRTEKEGSALIRPALEWLDSLSGSLVVGGKNCFNPTNAQERRFALGWDKRVSNASSRATDATEDAAAEAPALPGTEPSDDVRYLSPRNRLALVELAHKIEASPRSLATGAAAAEGEERGAYVGQFWKAASFSELSSERLIRAVSIPGGVPPMATLTAVGAFWLTANGFVAPITDDVLRHEQGQAGAALHPDQYVTDWVANEVSPAASAGPALSEPTQPPLIDTPDRWGRDHNDVVADTAVLDKIKAFVADPDSRPGDYAESLLGALDLSGPFTDDGQGGVVAEYETDPTEIATVNVERFLPDERAEGIAMLISWAMRQAFPETAA